MYVPPLSSQPPQGRTFGLRMQLPPHLPLHYTPLNPVQFLLRAALIRPDHTAVVHPEQHYSFTYAQWAARVLSLACALRSVPGWQEGDRVAVVSPNVPLIADAHYGVLAAGGIVTPLNYRNTASEIEYILVHCGARVVLVDHTVQHLIPSLPNLFVVCSLDSGGQDRQDAYEAFLMQGYHAWANAPPRNGLRDYGLLDEIVDENATSSLCYTSGTTGNPKGVETTFRGSYLAALSNALQSQLNGDTVYLWVLPMFHCCGWTFPWAVTAALGTHHMLRSVQYPEIWRAFLHGGVTHYCGAPTVQNGIVQASEAQRLDRPVYVLVAASAPSAHLLGKMESLHLLPIHVYGLTETYGPSNGRFQEPAWYRLDLEQRSRLQARQGHAYVSGDETRVVKLDTDELVDVKQDASETGEIVMRGNLVMKRYYKNPEATAEATRGNWFHTGDLAVRHPGGEIQIVDRGKDIIISGGENISSVMVEQELASHPWVRESAVVAKSHPKWGEAGHAVVVLSDAAKHALAAADDANQMLHDTLSDHCRKYMSGFAIPKWFSTIDELPKSSTGSTYPAPSRQKF